MRALVGNGQFGGIVRVPPSKSHTIRRLLIAALAGGSRIDYPLDSLDARSCVSVCRALGADITERRRIDPVCPNPADKNGEKLTGWMIRGGFPHIGVNSITDSPLCVPPVLPTTPIFCDVGNSGTTLYLALAAAALGERPVRFDGDEQIRRRSAGPLLEALSGLGVSVTSADGCAPITVQGPWKGGRVSLSCPTSQYLSAILLAAPLAPAGTVTELDIPLLNERPYIEMTLSYLDAQKIPYETGPHTDNSRDFSYFRIPGGAAWKPVDGPVPGDFSSAAFPACAAAVSGGSVTLLGLDPDDTQGDKVFFDMLKKMGCVVQWEKRLPDGSERPLGLSPETSSDEWIVKISRDGPLKAGEFDLNAVPDLLPVMTVMGAFASGDTALVNVAHARLKETDRIAVMGAELGKLGVKTEEHPDGLVIHGKGGLPGKPLRGGKVDGYGDHRVVMALAAAALGADGPVEISGAECAAVTYPGFLELLGAKLY